MKNIIQLLLVFGVLAAGLVLSKPVIAQDSNASLYVLHGVPGLTVDVYVNGVRQLDDFTPGTLAGPLSLPAGTYSVALTASDAVDDSSPVLGPIDLPLAAGMNYTAAAHLDATGAPTATLFTNDTTPASAGEGKLTVRHIAANAEGVEVKANGTISLGTFNNGGQLGPFPLAAATYSATILAGDVVVPPTPADVGVTESNNTIVYAWGDAADGAVIIASQVVALSRPAVSTTGIPTLGTFGLIGMIMVLMGVAIPSLRRFS